MPEIIPGVIGVDLGASFTKISYRNAWETGDEFNSPSSLVVIQGSPLIPSLVIYSDSNRKWLFGQDAADYRPLPKDKIYANWKISLYSRELTEEVDAHMDTASRFFEWLGSELRKTGIPVDQCIIKVCLPAFEGAERPGGLLVARLQRCGWGGRERTTVQEPRANTIGMFARGRNAAWTRYSSGPLPNYMRNFPEGGLILNHLRDFALREGNRFKKLMILDIGSFTTDGSFAILDAKAEGDCVRQAVQESSILGLVDQFERPLFDRLLATKGLEFSDLNFNDRERIKVALNRAAALVVPTRLGEVTFGVAEDIELAQALIEGFAEKVCAEVDRWLANRSIDKVVLTGGGVSNVALESSLRAKLESRGHRVAPTSTDSPITATTGETHLMEWQKSGESIERLATALGASAVLLDLGGGAAVPDDEAETAPVDALWDICICDGRNKNCVKCGGSGMLERARI